MHILHWLRVELWAPLWPNMVAPSAWTLAGLGASHWHTHRVLRRHRAELAEQLQRKIGPLAVTLGSLYNCPE